MKKILLSLVFISCFFVKFGDGKIAVGFNSAYAIEHIYTNCDQGCQDELKALEYRWDNLKRAYNKLFGNGAFEGLNLELLEGNVAQIRVAITKQCIKNSDANNVNCESYLESLYIVGFSACTGIATAAGVAGGATIVIPAIAYSIAASCALTGGVALSNVSNTCALSRAEGVIDCNNSI